MTPPAILDVPHHSDDRQLGDLPPELLESLVFLDPCTNLPKQIVGYVDRPRLPFDLEGQVVADMLVAGLAAASGAAAMLWDLHEAGREHGAAGHVLPNTACEGAREERGMPRNLHGFLLDTG